MSLVKKAIVGVAGATSVGYAAYFLVQQQEISRLVCVHDMLSNHGFMLSAMAIAYDMGLL